MSAILEATTAQEVRDLIAKGESVDAMDEDGDTALHLAVDVEVAKALLDAGADIDAKNNCGLTPLHVAENVEITKFLIDQGADVHEVDVQGMTPLHFAAMYGQAEVIQVLVQAGADIQATDEDDGRSPLHYAARNGNAEATRILIELGADVELEDNFGETPMDLAEGETLKVFQSWREKHRLNDIAQSSRPSDLATPDDYMARKSRGRMM